MPAVVTFWQTPEDEADLLNFILATGVVVAIPSGGVRTREELTPQPLLPYIHQQDPSRLRMGLEAQAHRVTVEEKDQGGERYFQVASLSPCLIDDCRGRMREPNRLGQSNLSTYWSYPDEGATGLIAKDPDFIRWAKRVFGWVRRHTPERVECQGYPYRATRRAKEAVDRGVLEAVLY